MDRICPICNRALTESKDLKYTDYTCYPPADDHHYAERFVEEVKTAFKVRLSPPGGRIFFRVYLERQCMDIWTVPEQREKINVGHLFEPDFSDIPALYQKMKTYLLFS